MTTPSWKEIVEKHLALIEDETTNKLVFHHPRRSGKSLLAMKALEHMIHHKMEEDADSFFSADELAKILTGKPNMSNPDDRRTEFKDVEWRQGKVLKTRVTAKWTDEEWRKANMHESCCAFAYMTPRDEGRSRELVYKYNSPRECEKAVEKHNAELEKRQDEDADYAKHVSDSQKYKVTSMFGSQPFIRQKPFTHEGA